MSAMREISNTTRLIGPRLIDEVPRCYGTSATVAGVAV